MLQKDGHSVKRESSVTSLASGQDLQYQSPVANQEIPVIFHHETLETCPAPAVRGNYYADLVVRGCQILIAALVSICPLVHAAVFDFTPLPNAVLASPTASGVRLSISGQNQMDVNSGVPNDIRNVNGVVAWSVNGTVHSYVFDPARSNWVGVSTPHVFTISDLSSADGVVAWSVKNAGQGSAWYRVYDPARGVWVTESGPGPIVQNKILNTNGVVAWSVATGAPHTTVYARVYDPTRGGWKAISTGIGATTSDLKTLDGVVAWSSSIALGNANVGYEVYDPGRGEWRAGSTAASSVASLKIQNSQISWNPGVDLVLKGYNPSTGAWEGGPSPLAYFAVSTNAGNAPFTVSFIDMSIGANSWSWSFGDGLGSSARRSPTYKYTTFGRFTATQTVNGSTATSRVILTDTILPVGTNVINNGAGFTTNPVVSLSPFATDNSGVVTDMRFNNTNNANWSVWETYATSKTWTLSAGNGLKNVFAQFRDIAGNTSATVSASIVLDTTAPPVVSFGNVAVSETIGQATVQVTLDHALGRSLSVRYSSSDGTATAPADYAARTGVLVFPSNTTSMIFSVPIVADALVELNETIFLTFSDPTNCIPGPQGTITILDNDEPTISFADANFSVVESNGVANVIVRLNAATGQPVLVEYLATNDTATVAADFIPTNGVLFFAPGQTESVFQVQIVSDTVSEFGETIALSLHNATNAVLAAPINATLTIVDDDQPLIYFAKASYPVSEGAGAVIVEVQLSKPWSQEVVFSYSAFGGTATPGGSGDYLASSGRLSLSANTTNQFFFVNLIDNQVIESAETVHLTLSGVTGASPGPRMEADVLIHDDDGPPVFVAPMLTTNGQFQVAFSGAPGQLFRLHVSTNLPNWAVLTTLTNNALGFLQYSIPVSSGPQKFYKTSVP